jgi:hypothetical protein
MGEDGVIWGDHNIDGKIRSFSWPRETGHNETKIWNVIIITIIIIIIIYKRRESEIYERDSTSR